ncbi:MAG TPA: endonuclease III [bacterium]|nr:endonuclease III [bacterium]
MRSPLDELILTILSQNTTDVNSLAAFRRLKNRFPQWHMLLSATYSEVLDTIKTAGLGPTKTRRILDLLPQVRQNDPDLTMDFVCSMSLEKGYEFLTGFKGVGAKTAACVLLFACGKPAFPVDTHVFRVASRIGLDHASRTREQLQRFLEQAVPEDDRYNLHMNLIRIGREVCLARAPRCGRCFLQDVCEHHLHQGS